MVVMATGPMFDKIGWGTYAVFAATNGLIIAPSVYLLFPETKKYSLEELDIIFALAYGKGENPVKVSVSGDIPPAGSPEAEIILGRADRDVPEHTGGIARRLSRALSRDSGRRPSTAV